MLIYVLFLISLANSQWIDIPDCPYGMQYVGNECQNAYGQTACPVGYYFDSVQGRCTGSQQTNTNCPQGTQSRLDEYGRPYCTQLESASTYHQQDTTTETTPYYGAPYPTQALKNPATNSINAHNTTNPNFKLQNSHPKKPQLRHHSYGDTTQPELAPIDTDPSSNRAIASSPQTHYFKFFSLFCMAAAFFVATQVYKKNK